MAKDNSNSLEKELNNRDGRRTLLGIMLGLLAILGLLNQGDARHLPVGSFIAYCFMFLFGLFYFVALLYLLFVALSLIFIKKTLAVHFSLTLLGILLIILSVLIASSTPAAGSGYSEITLQNFFSYFKEQVGTLRTLPTTPGEHLGGGLIGFFSVAFLNSTLTPLGTAITTGILAALGIVLCFEKLIFRLARFLRKHAQEKREIRREEKAALRAAQLAPKEAVIPAKEIDRAPSVSPTPSPVAQAFTYISRPAGANGLTKAFFARPGSAMPIPTVSAAPTPAVFPEAKPVMPAEEPHEDPLPEPEKNPVPVVSFAASETPTAPAPSVQEAFAPAQRVTPTPVPRPVPVEKPAPVKKKVSPFVNYRYPPLDLLSDYETANSDARNEAVSVDRMAIINKAFSDLGVGAAVISYKVGPSVTRFDVQPDKDVQVNKIENIVTDLSMRLNGIPARFAALVRGKPTSGLEIQNAMVTTVGFKEVLGQIETAYPHNKERLMVPFGKDISGEVIMASIKDFPHMLVAGTTGSGKSVFMHSMIMTLIMRNTPEELRLIIIDPKRVEMSKYRDMPHLLCPIITEYDKAKVAMDKLVAEMENRYTLFEELGVSDMGQFNEVALDSGHDKMPNIVVVVDEYADLVEGAKDIATPVVRIAQKARAAGIHLIISTQRPSVNVITGVIKANLGTRVALAVASYVDSNTILGQAGAETLLGNGDMLVDCAKILRGQLMRVQGCFVNNKEIKNVVDYLKANYPVVYQPEFLDLVDHTAAGPAFTPDASGMRSVKFEDDMYEQVKAEIMTREATSISSIQRDFGFGFPRAGKIFAQLQADGIVAKQVENGATAKGCKVLIRSSGEAPSEPEEERPVSRPPMPDFGGGQ